MRVGLLLFMVWLSVVGTACGSKDDEAPTRAGTGGHGDGRGLRVVGELGVRMRLPDGARVEVEGADRARISIAGLPAIEVTREADTSPARKASFAQDGAVGFSRSNGKTRWTCVAHGVDGRLQGQVQALCASLTPPEDPRVTAVSCTAEGGFDRALVEAMLHRQDEALVACFESEIRADDALDMGKFHVEAEHAADRGKAGRHRFIRPDGAVQDPACFAAVFDHIKADEAFSPQRGYGSFACTTTLSRF